MAIAAVAAGRTTDLGTPHHLCLVHPTVVRVGTASSNAVADAIDDDLVSLAGAGERGQESGRAPPAPPHIPANRTK